MGGCRVLKPRRTVVFFRWVCRDVNLDEEDVRVVGSCPELGEWNPCKGLVLHKSDKSCCWTSQAGVSLSLCSEVFYKYVICNKVTGELVRWEGDRDNRSIVPTGVRHIVEDDNGAFRDEEMEACCSNNLQTYSSGASKSKVPLVSRGVPARKDIPLQVSDTSFPSSMDKLKEFEEQVSKLLTCEPSKDDKVLLVFRLLPLSVERDTVSGEWKVVKADTKQDNRVLSSLLHFTEPDASEQYGFKVTFIGHPGVYVKDDCDRRKITQVLAPHHCIPVFVDEELGKQHLNLCHRFLWPVFHNMKVFDGFMSKEESLASGLQLLSEAWKSFQAVNTAYARVIEQHGSPSTLVWVHDYHLLLVPRQLYLRRPDFKLSFFLHSAFPSSEVLQCLPNREEILQSLLSASLVTFQIFDYSRNFVSCCSQLLGAPKSFRQGGLLQVEHEGRPVAVTTNHCVVPYQLLVTRLDDPQVERRVAEVRERFRGKTIIAAYDKCDRFAGLALKLRILRKFLLEYDKYIGKLVFLQNVTPISDNGVEDRQGLMNELERMAAEINKEFSDRNGGQPIVYLQQEDMSKGHSKDILAELQAADILFDTSIRDGLNLTPFMFCVAHSRDKKGAVIVSEFCGCSCALTGAYKINPWDTRRSMETLDKVLSEKQSEWDANFTKNVSYVSNQSLVKWVTQNISELKAVCQQGRSAQVEVSGKMKTLSSQFRQLDVEAVLRDYRKAKTRAIFLDTEGTLASKSGWTFRGQAAGVPLMKEGQPIAAEVLDFLRVLANDRGNTVMCLSGRNPSFLEEWYHSVQGIGLCAEHGSYWIPPVTLQPKANNPSERKWLNMKTSQEDDAWKAIAVEFLTKYVKRVQGSILETKNTSVAWMFREVGVTEVMNLIAQEVVRFLNPDDPQGLMYGYPVKVISGKGYVEVKRSNVDKGVAVLRTLEEIKKVIPTPVDFVLCIGDDRSDEDMFEAVENYFKQLDEASRASEPSSPSSLDRIRNCGGSVGSFHKSGSFASGSFHNIDDKALPSVHEAPRSKSRSAFGEDEKTSQAGLISTAASDPLRLRCKTHKLVTEEESQSYYTVTVGRKPSKAKFFVRGVEEVSDILQRMANQAIVSSFSRYASMPQLVQAESRTVSSSSIDSDHVQNITYD